MLFNSFDFLFFFPIVTILFFALPHNLRWLMLLIASCIFYMYFIPKYILILFFTIIIDYIAGIMIEKAVKRKHLYLVMSIIANVGVLAFFKYFNFVNDNVRHLANVLHWNYSIENLAIILPIGLSFHTFQAMSYTIEVYRGNQKAEKHFGIYALYVMFYPQLVAGPIERPQNVLHQFHEKHDFNYDMAKSGLLQMAWGLLKKCVVADRLSLFVNPVFDNPHSYQTHVLVIAILFFTIQIYCDFSGYSDIALGSARIMGFDLMTNFNFPYFSNNLGTFWRRWHISLSTWFNDYLFTPFITNYRHWGMKAVAFGIIMTFSVSGLWHGANWTFIIWGFLHGLGLSYELYTSKFRKKLLKQNPFIKKIKIGDICTFLFVCFTYIFFRARNLHDAKYIASQIVLFKNNFGGGDISSVLSQYEFKYCVIVLVVFIGLEYLQYKQNIVRILFDKQRTPFLRWSIYYILIMIFLISGVFLSHSSFIYFQF